MTHDEFIGQVQNRGRLSSREEAERAIRATLETLAERLAGREAEHLAAQLPGEIGNHLKSLEGAGFERMDLDAFYERVREREGSEMPDAVHHARTVVGVLRQAVSPGEFGDIETQLPSEFEDLLKA